MSTESLIVGETVLAYYSREHVPIAIAFTFRIAKCIIYLKNLLLWKSYLMKPNGLENSFSSFYCLDCYSHELEIYSFQILLFESLTATDSAMVGD